MQRILHSLLQAYENYSFEELRYAAPAVPRPSENMLVHSNEDGTYSANWTPGSVGFYNIQVTIDGIEAGKFRLLVNLGSDNILLVFPRVKHQISILCH